MTLPARITLYLVLTIASAFFIHSFKSEYDRVMNASAEDLGTTDLVNVDIPGSSDEEESKNPESTLTGWGAGMLLSVVLLGLLTAHDVSLYFGEKASKAVYSDGDVTTAGEEYEAAEEEWAKGNHLESIDMFRAYYEKHPKEIHVALRIAEIYEKDMNNLVAAALEYEDILKAPLPRKRWGWAAIHLCNLHFKLKSNDKAVTLLHRIVDEYGDTPAAEKARKRLALLAGEEYHEPEDPDDELA